MIPCYDLTTSANSVLLWKALNRARSERASAGIWKRFWARLNPKRRKP